MKMLKSKFDPYTPTLKCLTLKEKKSCFKHIESNSVSALVYKTHLFKFGKLAV